MVVSIVFSDASFTLFLPLADLKATIVALQAQIDALAGTIQSSNTITKATTSVAESAILLEPQVSPNSSATSQDVGFDDDGTIFNDFKGWD